MKRHHCSRAEKPLSNILCVDCSRRFSGKANIPDTTPPTVPIQKPQFLPSRDTPGLRATWLGHACYYVEFPSGLRVLFDPVFEDRCSPFSWLGPKRYTKMPCEITDIPVIDAVVISHNHYDHLSYPTVKEISEKHPNCHFFAPLGNKPWFTSSGIENMTELDWWEERDITLSPSKGPGTEVETVETPDGSSTKAADIKARISCLPCQHTSARGVFDRSKTLWASWSVESGGRNVYFAGYARSLPPFLQYTTKADSTIPTKQRYRLQGRTRIAR